ncbi:MAG: quinol dehydrogenase ferredoxin subunit NapH [Gammaproteobacteria bacterium]|nr:quinol dehydrogenase ferredoxin subunit NapH [Gammaproteobacteria bacterium]
MVMPGADALIEKGWFKTNQWLLLRRLSQLSVFALFMIGPLMGLWFVKGNLASSLTLEVLPLTDPFILLQTFFAGHIPETTAIIGAVIVTLFYLLVGGRVYCSWVCPVNIITDMAGWLRMKLDIKTNIHSDRATRYWLLTTIMLVAAITGITVWELVNPVSIVQRGLVFGITSAFYVALVIFIYDMIISKRGWCGHLCPMGAFYSLLTFTSVLRINAHKREHCNDCMDCYAICPEPQVIKPALKGQENSSPVIDSPNCTNCGRCIDICSKDVFRFSTRFTKLNTISTVTKREAMP